jgi:glycosyltransferase involved in cell wall biosynthesis
VLVEHGVPSLEIVEDANPLKGPVALAARWLYRRADAIVAVSRGAAADLAAVYRVPADGITVIGNPVAPADVTARITAPLPAGALPPPGVPLFTAAGRLVPAKDFATLLRAFRLVRDRVDARLVVLGDGPERGALEALRDGLGLSADVGLPGVVADPLPWFARSAAVVVSSLREGFGNVLVEAMACGVPIAATACPHGPAEILEQGALGPLAPLGDASGLAQAMLTALSDPVDPALLKARAACFSTDRIGDAYLALFQQILDRRAAADTRPAAFGAAGPRRHAP